jgi:MFS family permease
MAGSAIAVVGAVCIRRFVGCGDGVHGFGERPGDAGIPPAPLFIHKLVTVSVLLSLAFFFLELANSVLWALPMDMAPQYAGTAGGMMNLGFGVAGILSPGVFGFLVDFTGSWQLPFAASVLLLFVGAVLAFRIDPTRPVQEG